MTVTYELTLDELSGALIKQIKSQFGRHADSLKVKIEIQQMDETEQIMANPELFEKLTKRIASAEAGNVIQFTPEQFDELVKKHSI